MLEKLIFTVLLGQDNTMTEASVNTAADTVHSRAIRLPALETTLFPLTDKIYCLCPQGPLHGFLPRRCPLLAHLKSTDAQ